MKEKIELPDKGDFYKSPVITAIMWMVDNIHKPEPENKKYYEKVMPSKNTKSQVAYIRSSTEYLKKKGDIFYKAFCESYKVKKALRDYVLENEECVKVGTNLNVYKGEKVTKSGVSTVANWKLIIKFEDYPEDIKAIETFDAMTKELYDNINCANLKTVSGKNANMDLILDFLDLPINNTSNAYDLKSHALLKKLLDFSEFGYIYDSETIIDCEEVIKADDVDNCINTRYRAIYSGDLVAKIRTLIFENRYGILKNNKDISSDMIKKHMKDAITNCKASKNQTLNRLANILKYDTIFNIFFNNNTINKFTERAIKKIIGFSKFDSWLMKELYPICFIFSPYMLDHRVLHTGPIIAKFKSSTKSTKEKSTELSGILRKLLFSVVCGKSDVSNKQFDYWTKLINVSPSDNFWITKTEENITRNNLSNSVNVLDTENDEEIEKEINKIETQKPKKAVARKSKIVESDDEEEKENKKENKKAKTPTKQPVDLLESDEDYSEEEDL